MKCLIDAVCKNAGQGLESKLPNESVLIKREKPSKNRVVVSYMHSRTRDTTREDKKGTSSSWRMGHLK